jgi:hypothetical protein
MTIEVMDPTHEGDASHFELAARLPSLAGTRIGIISNGKEGTKTFFHALDQTLRQRFGVAEVIHRTKSSYSAPADPDIIAEAPSWDAVIAGIGD